MPPRLKQGVFSKQSIKFSAASEQAFGCWIVDANTVQETNFALDFRLKQIEERMGAWNTNVLTEELRAVRNRWKTSSSYHFLI